MKAIKLFLVLLFSVAVAACGGGSSDTTPSVTPVTSFPLQAAVKTNIANGGVINFTVSGSCSGTYSSTKSQPTAATFEGVTGLSVVQTFTMTLTNCTGDPVGTTYTSGGTSTGYYDSNYNPVGYQILGGNYGTISGNPPTLPLSVSVGDTAIYATWDNWTDSTKTTSTGKDYDSYAVEADTSTTAIVNLITRSYNTTNQLLYTRQARYRITGDGILTLITNDIQYSTTSTAHLVLTKI